MRWRFTADRTSPHTSRIGAQQAAAADEHSCVPEGAGRPARLLHVWTVHTMRADQRYTSCAVRNIDRELPTTPGDRPDCCEACHEESINGTS